MDPSRSLNGALNGNIGIIKSIVAEVTDPTNLPQVIAYMPVAWSSGGALGYVGRSFDGSAIPTTACSSTIGGSLSRPAERFPDTFGNSEFLKKYPYFLPCAVAATFSALTWVITFVFLQEVSVEPNFVFDCHSQFAQTVPAPTTLRTLLTGKARASSFVGASEIDDTQKPYPLRKLMTRRVLLSVINYAMLSLVDICYRAIQPLFLSTPVCNGGLGLDPPSIGKILAFSGILNGLFQVTCFTRAHALWGTKKLFVGGLCCAIPIFALFPVMNVLARVYGIGPVAYSAVALQVVWSLGLASCYGM